LPKLNNGLPSPLVFARTPAPVDGTHPGERRDVLRFWPTGYALQPDGGGAEVPVWVGSLVHERLRRESWPFNVLTAALAEDAGAIDLTAPGEPAEWHVLTVPGGIGCEGRPVTLIVSR